MSQQEEMTYADILEGHQVISISKIDYTWFFKFSDTISITTDGYWRIINENRIAITSEDEGQLYGNAEPIEGAEKAQHITEKKVVKTASIDSITGDLRIIFTSDGVELQFLQLSSGHESWCLIHDGSETICLGGGGIERY
jgi:hypothetical protein